MAPDAGRQPGDLDLVARAQKGEADAFNLLVTRHQDRLYNAVFRFCGHAEDAADILQRAFINAFRRLADFKGDSSFSTWMYRIAFNQAVSFRREGGGRRAVSIYGKDEELAVEPAFERNPAEGLEASEERNKLQRALSALEEDDRRIIVLKDVEGRSYDEIAAVLEIPKGTVRSRLHRARAVLREKAKTFMGTPSQS